MIPSQPPPFGPPQHTSNEPAHGWYRDPWKVDHWRWWDGQAWTAYTRNIPTWSKAAKKKPRLPSFLSIPVLLGAILTLPAIGYLTYAEALPVLLGFTPLLILLPTFAWLDRVEPEPRSSQIHALLWGACVAALISGVVNTIASVWVGEIFSLVVSAPFIEELTKGLAIIWALRRREIDGIMDGIVYAGWAALGFAIVENFLYFSDASSDGSLLIVFILRAILTPFAHPLFTMWTGLGIGWAVSKNRSIVLPAIAGYLAAVASHALWNGSIAYTSRENDNVTLLVVVLCFILLFITSVVTLVLMRRRSVNQFERSVPALAQRYGMTEQEVRVFSNWRKMLGLRKTLSRADRKKFDRTHRALARLAAIHNRPGSPNPIDVQILADQLHQARGFTTHQPSSEFEKQTPPT